MLHNFFRIKKEISRIREIWKQSFEFEESDFKIIRYYLPIIHHQLP